jgi:hypothetical protein
MTLREMQPRAGGFSFEREFKAKSVNSTATAFCAMGFRIWERILRSI